MDRNRLTPNQSLTSKFPIVGEREPSLSVTDWTLDVAGLVDQPYTVSFAELSRMPSVRRTWDTICVTGWTHLDHCWAGVTLQEVLRRAMPSPRAHFVRFEAYSIRGHDTSLPLDYALENILLAFEVDGLPLTREHGAPVRSVCGGKYFYKSVKWIRKIELLEQDQLGYWERTSAYHNEADPVCEQRFTPSPMDEEEFARRVTERDFTGARAVRDEKFPGLRGGQTDLSGANFERAGIKGCDLRRIVLRDARCQGANFSLTKFTNANLSGADLSACDCEGADFTGADLSYADLRGTALTAARFAHSTIRGARFLLVDVENPGLDEKDRKFLLDPSRGGRSSNDRR